LEVVQKNPVTHVAVDRKLIERLKKEHPEWAGLDAVEIVDVVLRSYLEEEKA